VDLAAKLNPLCAQAKLVTNPDDVDKVCKFVAKLAVEAGKAYLGLPPSLPNYDDLTNLGKDYVVKVASEQLESTGVPCPQECQDLIRKGIDLSLEQIKQNQNNASCFDADKAHSKGIEPLCAPEGVVTKPDPKGQQIPGVVQVQVTRKPGITDADLPKFCYFHVSASATNDTWIGHDFYLQGPPGTSSSKTWTATEPLKGKLFEIDWVKIPKLAPGESATIPLAFQPLNINAPNMPYLPGWWLPGHREMWWKTGASPDHDDWLILYSGAKATIKTTTGSGMFENFGGSTCVEEQTKDVIFPKVIQP
jgi:hypothetical protein